MRLLMSKGFLGSLFCDDVDVGAAAVVAMANVGGYVLLLLLVLLVLVVLYLWEVEAVEGNCEE
jgi:hypothetical protein